ncbi:MAG: fluoride efflux transporter CrcB [Acetobacteraceae bacterium]|nr:fluoride efflux transporter CrcB [Acetobacteraceae bacterium]
MTYLLVAIGGAIGSVARFMLAAAAAKLTGPAFPWGTLLINVLGSFIIGWYGAARANPLQPSPQAQAFVMTGFCGGFTTFSSFSLQTLELLQTGAWLRAAGYVVGSVALCLSLVWLGAVLGR